MLKISRVLVLIIALLSTIVILLTGCSNDSSSTAPEALSTGSPPSASPPTTTSTPSVSTVSEPKTSVSPVASTKPAPAEIAVNSITATQKMKSLKFDMDSSMLFTLPAGKNAGTMAMQTTATAAINIPDQKMDIVMDIMMDIPNQGKQNMLAEIYSTDGWMYMKATAPGAADQWTRSKLTPEMWARQSQLAGMTDFLKAPLGLEFVGSENIGGVDCYVLNVNPDINSLAGWMAGQMPSGQTGIDVSNLNLSKILQSFTVKEWIAKDTYLLSKQQIGLKLDLASLQPTSPGGSGPMNMDMNATLTYYDYGKPVTIQLPPQALNAKELPPPPTPPK
jgi:hypothetical protein